MRAEEYRPRQPNLLAPVLESAAIIGLGTGWYWLDRKTNAPDWDDPPWTSRFSGDAWRLDTNRFAINFVGHPVTGALSYGLARAHDLGPLNAFGVALGTSLAWELGIEFRERVSLNDIVVTAPSAVPLAEVLYKLGVELAAAADRDLQLPVDARGRFVEARVGAGPIAATRGGGGASFGASLVAEATLLWVEGARADAAFERVLVGAEHATGRLAVSGTEAGLGVDADAQVLVFGWTRQRASAPGSASHAVTVGMPLGFRYRGDTSLGFRDRVSWLRGGGPSLELWTRGDLGEMRLELDAGLHVGGHGARAYTGWSSEYPGVPGKSILARDGYFYGWGPSVRASASWRLGGFSVRTRVDVAGAWSIDGLDRARETLGPEVDAAALRIEGGAEAAIAVPLEGASIAVAGDAVRVGSRVGGVNEFETAQSLAVRLVRVW